MSETVLLEERIKLARTLLTEKKAKAAIKVFTEIREQESAVPVDVFVEEGRSRLRIGDGEGALAVAEDGLRAFPKSAKITMLKVNAFEALRRWDDVISLSAELRTFETPIAQAWVAGARSLAMIGETEASRELGQEAAAKFPHNPVIQTFLAELLIRTRKWEEADRQIERVRSALPANQTPKHVEVFDKRVKLNMLGICAANKLPENKTNFWFAVGDSEVESTTPVASRFVFVSGMPRSGTSALGRLLNCSTEIALFHELFNPYLPYTPSAFCEKAIRSRICAAPLRDRPLMKQTLVRAERAAFVGDKRPLFHSALPQTLENFEGEDIKILHIVRPVYDVCLSYQKRAENPDDTWDPLRNSDQCIHEINLMHQFFCEFLEGADENVLSKIKFLAYKETFTDIGYARNIFTMLGMSLAPSADKHVQKYIDDSIQLLSKKEPHTDAAINGARSISVAPSSKREDILQKLNDKLDWNAARKFEKITGITVL